MAVRSLSISKTIHKDILSSSHVPVASTPHTKLDTVINKTLTAKGHELRKRRVPARHSTWRVETSRKTPRNDWSVRNRDYHSCTHRESREPRISKRRERRHHTRREAVNGRAGDRAAVYWSYTASPALVRNVSSAESRKGAKRHSYGGEAFATSQEFLLDTEAPPCKTARDGGIPV